ncbi:MAG: nucleoside 2-deoxyribosyltransferase [Acidimicrobiia bacterium]|nr:nucleoside 2-deoxyribosyltransferase [Acidimicrobiia bacterium]MCY4435243.1 hypothetical protein [bacterium]
MPFKERGLSALHKEIVEIAKANGVELKRADNIFAPGIIIDQILDSIDKAHIVIAVCTGKNANVFFELGYAWRVHKPILLAETKNELPFDVQSYRTIMYGEKNGHNKDSWKNDLKNTIETVLKEGTRIVQPELSLKIERIDSNGHFGSYRLYVVNSGTMSMHNVRIELLDASNRGLKFDDNDQEDKLARLGSRVLSPGKGYPFFMRCDYYPHDPKFKFNVVGTDTSGEPHQFVLWKDLPAK